MFNHEVEGHLDLRLPSLERLLDALALFCGSPGKGRHRVKSRAFKAVAHRSR